VDVLSLLRPRAHQRTPRCWPISSGVTIPGTNYPYSENWSLDLQWQPYNTLLFSLGYLGNHGVHGVIPIPFNQPGIATPQHPVNGQIYSYGYQAVDANSNPLLTEQVQTTIGEFSASDGNTALRVPYIGYNPNSDFWGGGGHFKLQRIATPGDKTPESWPQINASYTWSHTLDEQSGLGLFL